MRTDERAYAERLVAAQQARWKRVLDVQWPYRAHLRAMRLGRTLDVGCGIGRNLAALDAGSVGVDHNADTVAIARARGFDAVTPEELPAVPRGAARSFDALLVAHVLEHMEEPEALDLLRTYLPFVRPGGRVVVITPQQLGFRSDPTHVRFLDEPAVGELIAAAGLRLERQYSFPFPRLAGRFFKYNEFVAVARVG